MRVQFLFCVMQGAVTQDFTHFYKIIDTGRNFLQLSDVKIFKEFVAFINRGNVIDLAVGVIIGTAFGRIVSSLVADVFTPLLGIIVGGVNLSQLSLVVGQTEGKEVVLAYGNFLQSCFDFLVTGFAIFMIIRLVNRIREIRKPEEVNHSQDTPTNAPQPTEEVQLLREIRDSLAEAKRAGRGKENSD